MESIIRDFTMEHVLLEQVLLEQVLLARDTFRELIGAILP